MKKIHVLTEEIKEIFDDQLFVFTETNIKLTDWHIHHNEDFINYVYDSLQEWSNGNIDNWNIDVNRGIFLKNKFENTPDIELSLFNDMDWAVYMSKEEKIMLFLLNRDFKINKEFIKRKNMVKLVILHELTHHYDNMFLKGKGINIGSKRTKIKHQNNIEKNAYTKQIIQQMEENIVDTIKKIKSKIISNVETNFSTILHYSLGEVLKENPELNNFMQSLDDKTLKKVYKEIGEYFKNRIEKDYNSYASLPSAIFDKINYNDLQKTKHKNSSK